MEELKNYGLQPEIKATTGVIAELKGALPGKTIAIRADIDALPIVDECNTEYQSTKSWCLPRLWSRWTYGDTARYE